jgi:hypothetical protein
MRATINLRRVVIGLFFVFCGHAGAQDARSLFRGMTAVGGSGGQAPPGGGVALRCEVELTRGSEAPRMVPPGTVFRSGDRIRLLMVPARDTHLYVINKGSDGQMAMLFPNQWNTASRVAGQQQAAIPAQGYFQFDHQVGTEQLALVFSAQPIPDLESMVPRVTQSSAQGTGLTAQEQSVASQLASRGTSRNLIVEAHQEAQGTVTYAASQQSSPGEPEILVLELDHQ